MKARNLMIRILLIAIVGLLLLTTLIGCRGPSSQPTSLTTTTAEETTQATTAEETTQTTTVSPYHYIYHYPFIDYIASRHSDLATLDGLAKAVVKATPIKSVPFEKDGFRPGTLTTIKIDSVLRSDGIIKENQEYILYEGYTTVADKADPNTIHVNLFGGFALPLRLNEHYLLFLGSDPQFDVSDYFIAGNVDAPGKFPLTDITIASKFVGLTAEQMEFPTGPNPNFDEKDTPLDILWVVAKGAFAKYLK